MRGRADGVRIVVGCAPEDLVEFDIEAQKAEGPAEGPVAGRVPAASLRLRFASSGCNG